MKSLMNIANSIFIALLILQPFCSALAQFGPIGNLRYEDDFSYLKSDTADKRGLDKLKYIKLSPTGDIHVSFGGEIREWFEIRKNVNWGDFPPGFVEDDNGALMSRIMFHSDFWYGSRLRLFAQANSTYVVGSPNDPIAEIEQDGIGLHQAFVETLLGPDEQPDRFLLRLGRQEFKFGNELVISSREGPNNRLPFDAASAIFQNNGSKVHVFAATPIIINTGIFDNKHIDEYLWGAYASLLPHEAVHLDVYYIGFNSDRRVFNHIPGKQTRHTIGARIWNHEPPFHHDIESMVQSGEFNDLTISAFNVTGLIRYIFEGIWKPMIGLEGAYITGDRSATDRQLNTYDPLYPKPTFGLGAPLGPANITSIRPVFGLAFDDALFVNGSIYFLARQSSQEGTFTPGMDQVRPFPPAESSEKYIGTQYALDLFFFPDPHWTFISFMAYIPPGTYVKETGRGRDIYFLSLSAAYKF